MKKIYLFITILIAIPLSTVLSQAQKWNEQQQEVWKNVETYWNLYAKGDAVGFLSYCDDGYYGWNYNFQTPMDKESATKFIKADMSENHEVMHVITPAVIWVKGDFAYADYYYQLVTQNSKGVEKTTSGRWTDILMKKGDKWVLVGDHGGQTTK